jgi:4-amino-4-deoxy-L-arabinose transferase-like glycosyltransferase
MASGEGVPGQRRFASLFHTLRYMKDRDRWTIVCFIAASGLILFFNLGSRTLENHDYLRHAEVARELVRSGDWTVLRLNGEIYLDKLPLSFWLISIPALLCGSVTPLSARLPSAFFAWAGTVVLFFWSRRVHRSIMAGLISGGVLLSSYQYFSYARTARPDMILCVLIVISLYLFYLGYEGEGGKRALFYGLSFLSMGFLFLTKGPLPLLMPSAIVATFLIKEKRADLLLSREFLLGYVLLAITVLPWALSFVSRLGFDQALLLAEDNRILSRHAPFYLYFGKIWTEFFPGSLLLPVLAVLLWKDRKRIWSSREFFFIIWFVLLLIGLTLLKFRTSRYLLPLLPPLALMIGGMGKRKGALILPLLFASILVWHGAEIYWARENHSRSPGLLLTGGLKPLIGESRLLGYRLDGSTQEEINFYLDRIVPNVKRFCTISKALHEDHPVLVLMPDWLHKKVLRSGAVPLILVREFDYKEGKLVLVSRRPVQGTGGPTERTKPVQ